MPDHLTCVELEPKAGPAAAAVIWLHGLGADGHDFVPIVPHLGLTDAPVRFVFPTARAIPVTINGGMRMPAWYDIVELDLQRRHDEAGILSSCAEVETLVAREAARGIAHERIVLAGFSQGGAIATQVALRSRQRLAGLLALSTYLVRGEALAAEITPAAAGLPAFCAHGSFDPMVPLARGRQAAERLAALGLDVTWKDYPMQHEVCLEEIEDVGAWLRARLV
jgi:phospholipase/carboxylesterase